MSDFKEDDFYVFLSDKMKLGEPEFVKDFFFFKIILIHNEFSHPLNNILSVYTVNGL